MSSSFEFSRILNSHVPSLDPLVHYKTPSDLTVVEFGYPESLPTVTKSSKLLTRFFLQKIPLISFKNDYLFYATTKLIT